MLPNLHPNMLLYTLTKEKRSVKIEVLQEWHRIKKDWYREMIRRNG